MKVISHNQFICKSVLSVKHSAGRILVHGYKSWRIFYGDPVKPTERQIANEISTGAIISLRHQWD